MLCSYVFPTLTFASFFITQEIYYFGLGFQGDGFGGGGGSVQVSAILLNISLSDIHLGPLLTLVDGDVSIFICGFKSCACLIPQLLNYKNPPFLPVALCKAVDCPLFHSKGSD